MDARRWSREIEDMGPLAPRAQSPASSESSFHSSRASPPPDRSPEVDRRHGGSDEYPIPDPSLPAPDVAPNIIPPSALTPSHRSLVLNPSQYQYSDAGLSAPAGPQFVPSAHGGSRPQSLFGGSAPDRDYLASLRTGRRQTVPNVPLGHVPEQSPSPAARSSLPTQLHQQHHQPQQQQHAPPLRPSSNLSHHYQGMQAAPPPFGTGAGPTGGGSPYPSQVPPRFSSVPLSNTGPYARDFGTPDLPGLNMGQPMGGLGAGIPGMSSMAGGTAGGLGGIPPSPYNPSPFARPASASTFSHAQLNLPATLQQIHTSLQALHERLSTLERTQSALLRRDERRRSSWGLGWILGGGAEEDALDTAELDADRAREEWEYSPARSQSTTVRLRKKRGLSARIVFALLTAIRRAVLGLGAAVFVGSVALLFVNPRWRRQVQMVARRARLRVARALAES